MAYTNTRSKNSSSLPTDPLSLSRESASLPGSEFSDIREIILFQARQLPSSPTVLPRCPERCPD